MISNAIALGLGRDAVTTLVAARGAKLALNFDDVVNKPEVSKKLQQCYERFTNQEYHTVGIAKGYLFGFGKTKDVRNVNLYKHLINDGSANEKGDLTSESKHNLLASAKSARLESRQLEQIFSYLLSDPSNDIKELNNICADLMYLYAQKNNIEAKYDEFLHSINDIKTISEYSQELERIQLQIKATESLFKTSLPNVLRNFEGGGVAFDMLLSKFGVSANENSKYNISDLIEIYAFKRELLSNEGFKQEVYNDFSKYIFTSSVGSLSAKQFVEAKYGTVIANMLEDSFLGDVDSSKNISRYFMETIYCLLNDGTKNFDLRGLCIGKDTNRDDNSIEAQSLGGLDKAYENAYTITENGINIVKNIANYYDSLSKVNIDKNINLIEFSNNHKNMLKWNLLGGRHANLNKIKKGIFYHIDQQLKEFKKPTADEYIYESLIGFHDAKARKRVVNSFQPKLNSDGSVNPFELVLRNEKSALAEIAKRVQVHYIDRFAYNLELNIKDKEQLDSLRFEYEKIINSVTDKTDKESLIKYFEILLGKDLAGKFMAIKIDIDSKKYQEGGSQINKFVNDNFVLSAHAELLSVNLLISRQEKYEQINNRKFTLAFDNKQSPISTYISEYNAALQNLEKTIKDSALFNNIKSITTNLDRLHEFSTFYNQIKDENINFSTSINKLADVPALMLLTDNAIKLSKEHVTTLYNNYTVLKGKMNAKDNELKEEDITQYVMLKMFFDFVDKNKNIDTFIQSFKTCAINPSDVEFNDIKKAFDGIPEEDRKELFTDDFQNCFANSNAFKTFKQKYKEGSIFKIQNEGTLLNNIVLKFKQDVGKFKYVESSISAINSFNKFRLQTLIRQQSELIKQFAYIVNGKEELIGSQKDCFLAIENCINYIDDSNCSEQDAGKIADTISKVLSDILYQNNVRDINSTIKLSNNKEFILKLNYNDRKSITDVYKELSAWDFKADLNKLPAVYSTAFKQGQPDVLTKAFRVIGALITGVTVDKLDFKNEKDNETKNCIKMFNALIEIQTSRLKSLSTMSYLHTELVNNFSQMFNGIQNYAKPIADSISLIEKLLQKYLSKPNTNVATDKFTPDEKTILLKALSKLTKNKYGDNLPDNMVAINDKECVNVARLIDAIKSDLNMQANAQNAKDKEHLSNLLDYVNNTVTMCQQVKELEKLTDVKDINYKIKQEDIESLKYLANYFNGGNNKVEKEVRTYSLSSNICSKLIDLFNLSLKTLDKNGNDKNLSSQYSSLFSNRSHLEKLANELKRDGLKDYNIKFFDDVSNVSDHSVNIINKVDAVMKSKPNLDIDGVLKELNELNKGNSKNQDLQNKYKYYINAHQYNLLGNKLANFYVKHYFHIENFQKYFDSTIGSIVEINKNAQKEKEISNYTDIFQDKFGNAYTQYQKYSKDSTVVLDHYATMQNSTTPIYELLCKKELHSLNPEWQNRNVSSHEWLIKT